MISRSSLTPGIAPALGSTGVRSNDIDLFSPQLYTSGDEEEPEYDLTACGAPDADDPEASTCTYERLRPMKVNTARSEARVPLALAGSP